MGPPHVPCHGFPRAVVALVVQPPANPVLPNNPCAFPFSLTLLAALWPLRADIPAVFNACSRTKCSNKSPRCPARVLLLVEKGGSHRSIPLEIALGEDFFVLPQTKSLPYKLGHLCYWKCHLHIKERITVTECFSCEKQKTTRSWQPTSIILLI